MDFETFANAQLWPFISSIMVEIVKCWFYENTSWDESNKIPHACVFP